MAGEIYQKLREKLDQYSCGFPLTESGVEFKILERIFTEEEAEMFLGLSLQLETPEKIARRLGIQPDVAAPLLQRMKEKGNVFSWHKDDTVKYGAVPFVLGLYEFQLNRMDRELAGLCEQYFKEAFLKSIAAVDPLMRAIPIHRSLEVSHPIATYEDSRRIIQNKKIISLAKCICRVQQGLIDQGCGKPVEVCLSFGASAQHYIDQGLGLRITVEEALKVLDAAEEAGLVIQPTNSRNPGGLCCCCGDCCAILRALNEQPRPAEAVASKYFAIMDTELCTGCEICLERCQMGAIFLSAEGLAQINLDRCIGCGLCVTKCPARALHLEIKPEGQWIEPPETALDALTMMARKRGKAA
ncbi:MAG: 4Fe-4S ferredoxin [Deltaproteobacteria bacterium RBG_13_43_22]|nr:MAG: 4Fe-4S ferredoxin [Deltaproteobacteria bacterium RBG_13_43_22]